MRLIPKWLSPKAKTDKAFSSGEGSYRGPFFGNGELGNTFKIDSLAEGWQRNLTIGPHDARRVSAVYACVMLTARAVSQCRPIHLVENAKGALIPSRTSAAAKLFRIPNSYQTWTLLLLNMICELLFNGESVWLALRDERFNIIAFHPIPNGAWSIHVDPETHEIFYGISNNSNDLFAIPEYLAPARDIVHFRQYTPRHPLCGESPIKAAAHAIGINVALSDSQLAFFNRMNRPSGILTTDMKLSGDQMKQLRTAFEEQAEGWRSGGVPILGSNLKFQATSLNQTDTQLIEQQKMSIAEIARVFGVPMALISDASGPQGGTEAMIGHWLSVGLGSVIETVERTLDRVFDLPANETIELDPTPLLRVDFAAQIDGLTKAVQGGLMSINEARKKRGLAPVEFGDVPVLQQQMTPIDQLHDLHASEIGAASKAEPANEPPAEPEPEPPAEPEADKDYLEYALRKSIAAAEVRT